MEAKIPFTIHHPTNLDTEATHSSLHPKSPTTFFSTLNSHSPTIFPYFTHVPLKLELDILDLNFTSSSSRTSPLPPFREKYLKNRSFLRNTKSPIPIPIPILQRGISQPSPSNKNPTTPEE